MSSNNPVNSGTNVRSSSLDSSRLRELARFEIKPDKKVERVFLNAVGENVVILVHEPDGLYSLQTEDTNKCTFQFSSQRNPVHLPEDQRILSVYQAFFESECNENSLCHGLDVLRSISNIEPTVRKRLNDALIDNAHYAYGLAEAFVCLNCNSILTPKNCQALIDNAQYAYGLARAFAALDSANLLSENRQALITNAQYANSLGCAFVQLHCAKLLTPENRQALIDNAQYAYSLGWAFVQLNSAKLLTPENRQALTANAQYANSLARAFVALDSANILTAENRHALIAGFAQLNSAKLLRENCQALIDNAQYAYGLARAFVALDSANILRVNRQALIDNAQYANGLARAFAQLNSAKLLRQNGQELIANAQYASYLANAFDRLSSLGILTPKNCQALIANAQDVQGLGLAFDRLNGPGILTPENCQALIDNAQYANGLAEAFDQLNGANILAENRQALIANAEYARGLARGFAELNRAKLLTPENRQALIDNAQYASSLADAFGRLSSVGIPTPENCQVLIANAQYAYHFARAFFQLNKAKILAENCQALIDNAQYAEDLAGAFVELNSAGILAENRQALIDNAQYAHGLAEAFARLISANILRENCQELIANAQYAYLLAEAFVQLNSVGILTPENRQALIANVQYANDLARAFVQLNSAGILTPENRQALIANAQYAQGLARAFARLISAGILTLENRQALIANAQNAEELAAAYVRAHSAAIPMLPANPRKLTREEIINSPESFIMDKDYLRIHPLFLQERPGIIARALARHILDALAKNFPTSIPRIVYLERNSLKPTESVDVGGLRNQFITELFKNLLDGDTSRTIKIENQMPQLSDPPAENEIQSLIELGVLLGICFVNESVISGRIFPDHYFKLLQNPSILKDHITGSELIEMCEGFEFDDGLKRLLGIYHQAKPISEKDRNWIKETYLLDTDPPEGFKKFIEVTFEQMYGKTVLAAHEIAKGMNNALSDTQKRELQKMGAVALSERIQGKSFDRKAIAGRIKYVGDNKVVKKKTEWLIEHITNPKTDQKWVEDFIFAVTGRYCIDVRTNINISDAEGDCPQAHTCFMQLDVPIVHTDFGSPNDLQLTDQEKFLHNLQLLIAIGSTFDRQ